jgi:preprotein translocase subunit YajC
MHTPLLISNDVIVGFVLVLILLFIFFVYLLLRRSAQQFKEGMEGERR